MTFTSINASEIARVRVLALRSALKLECMGLKRRGKSVYSIVKTEFGFKGDKQSVLSQLNDYIDTNIMGDTNAKS